MKQALLFQTNPERTELPRVSPLPSGASHPLLSELGDPLAHTLMTGRELCRESQRRHQPVRESRIETVDSLLGGLPRGTLTEIHGSRSSGRMAMVLSTLAAITSTGENAALVDMGDELDPRSAWISGVELSRLLWVRPQSVADSAHAAEILLGTGFPLVVVDLGIRLQGKRVNDTAWVRLERAARKADAILLVSSPWPVTGIAAEGVLRVSHGRGVWRNGARKPLLEGVRSRIETTRHRRHRPGRESDFSLIGADTIPRKVWHSRQREVS